MIDGLILNEKMNPKVDARIAIANPYYYKVCSFYCPVEIIVGNEKHSRDEVTNNVFIL